MNFGETVSGVWFSEVTFNFEKLMFMEFMCELDQLAVYQNIVYRRFGRWLVVEDFTCKFVSRI